MSAIPEQMITKTAKLSEEVTRPFPNSTKIYVQGGRADVQVGMREVTQADTPTNEGVESNPPITLYDTSGPYTDPAAMINLRKGLAPLREAWITERGDSELLGDFTSAFAR